MALEFHFQPVANGMLALTERPKLKELGRLQAADCQRLVTLLAAKGEQAERIGQTVESLGIVWTWVKLSHASLEDSKDQREFLRALRQLSEALEQGERIVIHCSAGIHRTGMLAYGILRQLGYEKTEALELIAKIRPETAEGLLPEHLDAVDSVLG